MAQYFPPTEFLPIFDSSVFDTANDPNNTGGGGGGGNYLNFPVAQGAQTMLDTDITGDLFISKINQKITFTNPGSSNSIILGDNQTTLLASDVFSSAIIGVGAAENQRNIIDKCTVLGYNAYRNDVNFVTANDSLNDTAIGYNALSALCNTTGFASDNTSIGFNTLNGLEDGNYNVALGSEAGNGFGSTQVIVNGNSNTFLGAQTGLDASKTNTCTNSTAIGRGALITDDNQIMMGTNGMYVKIPNYIEFSDGSQQKTSPGVVNIIDFGAKGDDLFDNTTAINNAITSLTSGKTLYIPQGIFRVYGSLNIISKVNIKIFSEGTISAYGTNYSVFNITDCSNVSFNGSLTLSLDFGSTFVGFDINDNIGFNNDVSLTGIYIKLDSDSIGIKIIDGSGNTYCKVSNVSIEGTNFSEIGIITNSIYSQFSNILIRKVNNGVISYSSGCIFDNINIATNSVLSSSFIMAYDAVLTFSGVEQTIISNSFIIESSCCNIAILGLSGCVISGCVIISGGFSPIGDLLGNNTVPVAYQTYKVAGVYLQNCSNIIITGCYFFDYQDLPIGLNGCSNIQIINNSFKSPDIVGLNSYIKFIGNEGLGFNKNNMIQQNIAYGLGSDATITSVDTSIVGSLYSTTTLNQIKDNMSDILVSEITVALGAVTVYIDGSLPQYNIYEGTTATIIITNVSAGNQFLINYIRTGTYNFQNAPITTQVKILKSTQAGYTITNPVICDGIYQDADEPVTGNKLIQFQKTGTYIFKNNTNPSSTQFGNYSISALITDPHPFYEINLANTNPINLQSTLFFNSVVNINTTTGATVLNLLNPSLTGTNAIYTGATTQIFNNTGNNITLTRGSGTGTFQGQYGNSGSTLTMPNNTWVTVVYDGTNYQINERSENPVYTQSYSTSQDYSSRLNFTNATIRLNPSNATPQVVTLPSATSARVHNTTIKLINISSNNEVLQADSGGSVLFSGKYGNGQNLIDLLANTWVEVYSNGTAWIIQDRSSNWTHNLSLTGNTDLSSSYQFNNCTIRLASTGAFTFWPPQATNTNSVGTTTKIINTSNYDLTLTSATNFLGKFGSGLTTQPLPQNSWVEIYSNGSNWLVQDKTVNAIYYLNPGNTALNWATNNSYFNGIITLLPPDQGTTGTALLGTASQSGNVLTVQTLNSGTLSAGSVITINSQRMFIYGQLTTTGGVGSAGTYAVSVNQTVGAGTAFTGFTNNANVMIGTFTATGRDNITTNIPTGTINTIAAGGNNINAGTVISGAGIWNNATYAYILNDGGAGGGIGTYNISNANIGNITNQTYFATSAQRINLPDPSISNRGLRLRFQNQSYMCINITTVTTNPLFGGLYGQQNINSPLTTTSVATADGRYLLRPQQTVVLESDGSLWNAIEGTTFGGTKLFGSSLTSTTSATNNVFTNISTMKVTTMNESNLYGVGIGNNGMIYNQTNNPLVLSITVYVAFNNPVDTTGTALPTRFVRILRTNTTTNNLVTPTNPVIFSITAPVITVASPNFSPSATTINCSGTTTFTLLPTEGFLLGIAKSGGTSAESTPDVRVEIARLM